MPFPPPPVPTNKTNDTAQQDDHPTSHNLIGQAINETVTELGNEIIRRANGDSTNAANILDNANRLDALETLTTDHEDRLNLYDAQIQKVKDDLADLTVAHDDLKDIVWTLRPLANVITGWVNIGNVGLWAPYGGDRQIPQFRKRGDAIDVRFAIKGGNVDANYSSSWYKFQPGFRPPNDVSIPVFCVGNQPAGAGNPRLLVRKNGDTRFYGLGDNKDLSGAFSFWTTEIWVQPT